MFKDLLYKYKNGKATEDEKLLVEEELEKYEEISDFISEKYMTDFESVIGERSCSKTKESAYEQDELLKELHKGLNKRLSKLAKKVFIFLLIFLIVIPIAYSAFLKIYYYNPAKKYYYNDVADEHPIPAISTDLYALSNLLYPGYLIDSTVITNEFLGKYELSFYTYNSLTDTSNYLNGEISKGKFNIFDQKIIDSKDSSALYFPILNENEEILINDLKEVPSNSIGRIYIKFDNTISMDKLLTIMKENPSIKFDWIKINTGKGDNGDMNFGFCPTSDREYDYTSPYTNKTYKNFYIGKNPTAKDMESNFTSLLTYLTDNKKFMDLLNRSHDTFKIWESDLNLALDYVNKNGIKASSIVVTGKVKDLLELKKYSNIHITKIDDIKLSKYSK